MLDIAGSIDGEGERKVAGRFAFFSLRYTLLSRLKATNAFFIGVHVRSMLANQLPG